MKTIHFFSKSNTMTLAALLVIFSTSIFNTGCKDDDELAGTWYGEQASLGQGTVKTYVLTDDLGLPLEIGVELSKTAFESLPAHDHAVSLDFPKEANTTPILNMGFGWNVHGHEPPGIYDKPHFDFHYYMVPKAEYLAITPADTIKGNNFPSPDYFPADHVPTGLVPQMGNHWIDTTSPELNGQPFTHTFIYGSYNGKVTFTEPMITKDFIKEKLSFEKDIRQPAKYPVAGKYYATTSGFRYDEGKKAYKIYLKNFVKR